jgi:hypothetical protein
MEFPKILRCFCFWHETWLIWDWVFSRHISTIVDSDELYTNDMKKFVKNVIYSFRMAIGSDRMQIIHIYQFHNVLRINFHAGSSHRRSLHGHLSHSKIRRLGDKKHSVHYFRYMGYKRTTRIPESDYI